MKRLLERLRVMGQQLQEVEGRIVAIMGKEPVVARAATIRGIGVKVVSLIAGHAGDISRLGSGKELVKLAGLDPMPNESGKKRGKSSISHRGRWGLRLSLYRASWGVIRALPQFGAYYWHLRTRSNNPLEPEQAIAAVANKVGRVIYRVGTGNEPFRPELVAWGTWK